MIPVIVMQCRGTNVPLTTKVFLVRVPCVGEVVRIRRRNMELVFSGRVEEVDTLVFLGGGGLPQEEVYTVTLEGWKDRGDYTNGGKKAAP